jgi:hypothetical protein
VSVWAKLADGQQQAGGKASAKIISSIVLRMSIGEALFVNFWRTSDFMPD